MKEINDAEAYQVLPGKEKKKKKKEIIIKHG
jgi:hypothetical protein